LVSWLPFAVCGTDGVLPEVGNRPAVRADVDSAWQTGKTDNRSDLGRH
jgi:hypothetical protein